MRRFALSLAGSMLVVSLGATSGARAAIEISAPAIVADSDIEGNDEYPQIATDGHGTWIAVWQSTATLDDTIAPDFEILYSRSFDDGATWTPRAALNTDAATDQRHDEVPRLAADGGGNWVAVWEVYSSGVPATGGAIRAARSSNGGATWSPPVVVASTAAGDSVGDPDVVTDGHGLWIAAWINSHGAYGADQDIVVSRSTNGGASWTTPTPLNTTASQDSVEDFEVQLATDGAGTWIAVWTVFDRVYGSPYYDEDVMVSRSTDGGVTWSAPAALTDALADPLVGDISPHVTTDRAGHWVAVWQSIVGHTSQGDDWNIRFSRSVDGGVTWSPAEILNTNAATDLENDQMPRVITDGWGLWITVWHSARLYNDDADIVMAQSRDFGAHWTDPVRLNTNAATDSWYDWNPVLATAGAGRWVAVWFGGPGFDIYTARLTVCDLTLRGAASTQLQFPPVGHVVDGLLSELRSDGGFSRAQCLGSIASVPRTIPPGDPPLNDGWYFLARGSAQCTSYGDSTLVPDPRDALDLIDPCP